MYLYSVNKHIIDCKDACNLNVSFIGNEFSFFFCVLVTIAIILWAHVCPIIYSNYPVLNEHLAINYFLL